MSYNSYQKLFQELCDSISHLEIIWATVTAVLAVMVLLLLANLRHRHKVRRN